MASAIIGKVAVKVHPDTKGFRRELRTQLKAIERSTPPLKVKIRADINHGQVRTELTTLTRDRNVLIRPDLDNAAVTKVGTALAALSGARIVRLEMRGLTNMIRGLDLAAPKIAAVGLGIFSLSGFALSASANLFSLSQSLASIGGAAFALPGIFGGLAVGIGISYAALKDFNKELPQVSAQMAALQNAISGNFWDEARAPIKNMIDTLLPQFRDQAEHTATHLGRFFGSVSNSFSQVFDGNFGAMFSNLNDSIDIAAKGSDAWAKSLLVLGQVGSAYLPRLAGFVVEISNKFSDFLTKAQNDGSLYTFIDNGIEALKDLGHIIRHTVNIFDGIADAARNAGGSTVDSLRQTLQGVDQVVNSSEFQTRLTQVFKGAFDMIDNIGEQAGTKLVTAFKEIGETLSVVLPIVGDALGTLIGGIAEAFSQPVFQAGLTNFFLGIKEGINALTPLFGPLGTAIGMVATSLGNFISAVAPLLATTAETLVPALEAILPPIDRLVNILSTGLGTALAAIEPVILRVAQAFGGFLESGVIPAVQTALDALLPAIEKLAPIVQNVLTNAFGALTPVVQSAADIFAALVGAVTPVAELLGGALAQVMPIIGAAFTTILDAVGPLVTKFGEFLHAVLTPLIPVVLQLAQTYLPQIADAIAGLIEAIGPFIEKLTELWNFISPVLIPVLQFLAEILLSAVVGAIEGVTKVIEGLTQVIGGIVDFVQGVFTGNWTQAWEGIKAIFEGVITAIIGAIQTWLNVTVLGVFRRGLLAIKGVWDNAWNGIKSFFEGIKNGITTIGDNIWSALKTAFSTGVSNIKTMWETGWNGIKTFLDTAWTNIKTSVSTGISNVVTFMSELPGKITTALGNLGTLLLQAGKDLLQGLINGITSKVSGAITAVKDAVGSVISAAKSALGIKSPSRVFRDDIGKYITLGLAEGVESSSALNALDRATVELTQDTLRNFEHVGAGVIDAFIEGMESRYSAVFHSLSRLADGMQNMSMDIMRAPEAMSKRLNRMVNGALAEGATSSKVLNYYAAPGSSISAEEDLFAAANRTRMGW